MKFSYNWLQTYFKADTLPEPKVLAEKITFHSSEVEEVTDLVNDTVLDVKVLPDKSAWLMSHRGLAKELSVILPADLIKDPLRSEVFILEKQEEQKLTINLATEVCDYYAAVLLSGIKVGPSPLWLKERLEAIGQRSINNIVDATNYVMFEIGQPLHAFAADKLQKIGDGYAVGVRQARVGETIVTLTGESYQLSVVDTLIIDQTNDQPIGIAGIKGGKYAAVDSETTSIILESAHFNRFAIRQTAKNLKLPTDAAKRFENGIASGVAPLALSLVTELIIKIAGGTVNAQNYQGMIKSDREPVACSLQRLNSVLGLQLNISEVTAILERFGYSYEVIVDDIIVTPPFERDDLNIAEDLIEEIGRMYGLHHIVAIAPAKVPVYEYNKRFYYGEKIRTALVTLGFSEVYTSSFRAKDIVRLENALASDKGCLRSSLAQNLAAAKDLNIPHRDLLGLVAIKLFEIGTVFASDSEEFRVALAVQKDTTYKSKQDAPLLTEALASITAALGGVVPKLLFDQDGVAEFSLDQLLVNLPEVTDYVEAEKTQEISYKPFSVYPASSRDIAMWVGEAVTREEIQAILREAAGPLCVRVTHLDTFAKDGRISYAFRLVLQSAEKTLTEEIIQELMQNVYQMVANKGWEAR